MQRRFLPVLFLLAAMSAVAVPVMAQDAWVGTWKLNLAKSKYDPANLFHRNTNIKPL